MSDLVIDAIDAEHQPVPCDALDIDLMCGSCLFLWPCPTHLLIHPEAKP